jgi:hypothetical protein
MCHNQNGRPGILSNGSVVQRLLNKAHARSFANLLLEQSTLALAVAMGGVAVLLLAGTSILDWYWIALLALASLGIGLYRLRATVPSKYRLAQRIDRRLHLADALSTATHFAQPGVFGDEAIRDRQRQEAESVARTVDVRAAVPFSRPRFLYPAVALAAVAGGLFALRYAVTGSLNLQPSLVKIAFDTLFPPAQQVAKNQKKPNFPKSPANDQNDPDAATNDKDQAPDSTLNNEDAPDTANPETTDAKDSAKQEPQAEPQQAPGQNNEQGEKSQNGNDAQSNPDSSKDSKSANPKNAQDARDGSSENSSLMDRLKDAMANMMNKMKPSSAQNGNQNQQQNAQGQAQQGQQKSNQKGEASKQQAQNNADSQSDASDSGDKSQSADAKGAEKASDKNASPDSKSGIGSSDGDKAAHEAEQLQAMGKITEIFGKRAQNVQGEVMVEVGSSKQQLKTPWVQKRATHTDEGGEIHRDEVPLIYQQFVEQYFEQIRKTPEPAKTPKSKN